MATITRAQAMKWDADAKKYGTFSFDVRNYVIWSEKALVRNTENEDGTITQHKIRYAERRGAERFTTVNVPVHIVNTLYPLESGCYRVIEESCEDIGEATEKKSYATLCKLSANY